MPDSSRPRVVLRPPLELMRPRASRTVPGEAGLPGGTQYSVKLDGIRALLFVLEEERIVLQSRTGRNRAEDFPDIARAAGSALPPGTVLDGEVVAWHQGHFAFEQLLRSRSARGRDRIVTAYVAFDLLATPDEGDVRERPLEQRWEMLRRALVDVGPPLELVLATTDYTQALVWHEHLVPLGVEGLVCRGLASRYRPGDSRSWVKIRHADTADALVLGITGDARRPYSVLLQLDDGHREVTPKLDAVQARQVADALAAQAPPAPADRDGVRMLAAPLLAEAHRPSGRHGAVRFERLKADQNLRP